MVIPTHIAEKGAAPSFREREETRRFYTETLLHTESFTHKHFYTQTLSHRDVFHAHTHRRISTQRLLHENTLTHRRFYTQTLLHTYAFTCRCLFTDARTHFHTQTLLHTDAFAHTNSAARQHHLASSRNASASEFSQHRMTRMTLSHAPFAQTSPSANETATTKRPQTSRVRDFKQTFCIQKFRDMHIYSLDFKTMPWHAWFQNKIERYNIERYNDSRSIFLSTAHAFQWKHHIYFFVLCIT